MSKKCLDNILMQLGCALQERQTDGWMERGIDGRMDRQIDKTDEQRYRPTDGQTDR